MQLISPCSKGDSRSLLVSAIIVDKVVLWRMAAPKSLEPLETCFAVSGIMDCSVVGRRALAISCADDMLVEAECWCLMFP